MGLRDASASKKILEKDQDQENPKTQCNDREAKRFPSEKKTIGFVSDISVTHIKEKWFLNPSPHKISCFIS